MNPFYDHSGQGFGLEYKGTRMSMNFVSSSDTTSTVPPYFFLNIKSGTPSLELRQRLLLTVEQDFRLGDNKLITLLGEYHHMGDATDTEISENDSSGLYSFPGEDGWVIL
ncbi:hypothetical protein [Reichenbachiella agariperforans]|nr:hypothetical protein [Reichenbachiella agariperforans]